VTFKDYWQSNISAGKPRYKAVFFDVDGTVVSGRNAMPGAAETINFLRSIKTPFLFLTNDSHHSPEQKAHLINRTGVKVDALEVVSCSHALKDFVLERNLTGKKVFIMGEFGTPCYAKAAELIPCRELEEIDECEFVIAGEGYFDWHDTFQAVMNYFLLHRDRTLVVPNPDSCWPNSNTGKLGIGAGAQARFIAGLLKELSIDIELFYLGKPYPAIYEYALRYLQKQFDLPDLQISEVMMLGDSLTSDMAGAARLGMGHALTMTGVTTWEILNHVPEERRPELIFESIG